MIWEEGLFSQIIQLDSGNQIIIFHYNTDFNEIRTVINVWYNNKYLLVYENLLFSRSATISQFCYKAEYKNSVC